MADLFATQMLSTQQNKIIKSSGKKKMKLFHTWNNNFYCKIFRLSGFYCALITAIHI